jgi:hypothetical protein
MARKRTRLLCEDKLQQVFVRRLLKILDFRVTTVALPGGNGGAAEQYVREKFPGEVRRWRSRRHQQNLALVAVIDADTSTVNDRKRQLNQRLVSEGMMVRQNGERVAMLVPKRNIETWIASLLGKDVDEKTDYKHLLRLRGNERECRDAVVALKNILDLPARRREAKLHQNHPPSLRDGCSEISDRLPH